MKERRPEKGSLHEVPTSVLSLTALQPHPRVNFCSLPPEQCYQPPGVPDDRGPSWVGSHGAPQRLQVRIGGEGRVCGSLSQGEGERSPGVVVYICSSCFGSVSRGSRQTGASSALEAWMLRSIRSPACWRIWTEFAVILLGDQTDRSVSCVLFLLPRPQPVPFCGFSASDHPFHSQPTLFATNGRLVPGSPGSPSFLLVRPCSWELVKSHYFPGAPTWLAWMVDLALLTFCIACLPRLLRPLHPMLTVQAP